MNGLDVVAEVLNRFPEVTWDRCTADAVELVVYGWIDRDGDAYKDFLVLRFDNEGAAAFHTSSAALSRSFATRLWGDDAGGEGHLDCERVEQVFGDRVARMVVLPKG